MANNTLLAEIIANPDIAQFDCACPVWLTRRFTKHEIKTLAKTSQTNTSYIKIVNRPKTKYDVSRIIEKVWKM